MYFKNNISNNNKKFINKKKNKLKKKTNKPKNSHIYLNSDKIF